MERQAQRHLSILTEIAEGRPVTQRSLARRLDIALGLANLYLKRLARKGYIKMTTIPASRLRYLLTPKGIAEKTRLTYEYMEYSLELYRGARATLRQDMAQHVERGRRVVLCGTSEAAELAFLTLRELGFEVVAVVDDASDRASFLGIPVTRTQALAAVEFDCVVVAGFRAPTRSVRALIGHGVPRAKIVTLRAA